MKKAFRITYENLEFYIDEDARILFYSFIEKSERELNTKEFSLNDLRSSIVTTLRDIISSDNQVINKSDIESMIARVSVKFDLSATTGANKYKKMVRDKGSSILGGVCAGLSNYFDFNLSAIRLIFIVLALIQGFGIILYLILWFVLPSTRIYDTDSYSAHHITENSAFNTFIKGFGALFLVLFRGIGLIIGVSFIIFGIVLLSKYFNVYSWHNDWYNPFHHFNFNYDLNLFHEHTLYLAVCIFILIAIPILSLIYNIIKQVFNIKTNDKIFRLTVSLIWFVCLLTTVGLLISKKDMNRTGKLVSTQVIDLKSTKSEKIYIETSYLSRKSDDYKNNRYIWIDNEKTLFGRPDIEINHTNDSRLSIHLKKEILINNKKQRLDYDNISYKWYQKDSLITLDNFFYAPGLKWWQLPNVTVEINVPNEKQVLKLYNIEDN